MSDKVAVITGASKGIGKEIAATLYQGAYQVVICSRKLEDLELAKADIESHGGKTSVLPIECDISDYEQVEELFKSTIKRFGKVDVLVNNAAIARINNGRRFEITEISYENWNETISINLTGAFNCCKSVIPYFLKEKKGHIINISSALERTGGGIGGIDYIASKGGLVGLSKGLAHELGKYNIRVNVVSPGRTATTMVKDSLDDKAWVDANVPLGRLGRAEDVARLVAFLANDSDGYINGANIDCNGGWVIS